MHSLHRRLGVESDAGKPIRHGLASLGNAKVTFRRSELSMVSAVAGQGKSSLALAVALSTDSPTLYFSADTNQLTQAVRTLAMATGRTQTDVETALLTHTDWCASMLKKSAGHIRWVFDSSPTLDDLEGEILAYVELAGRPPELVIVDNASDVVIDGADEWGALRELMRALKHLARHYDIAMLALHHSSDGSHGDPCPPRASIQGKVSQVPAVILTVASTDGWMALAPVKNRFGPADPTGRTALMLDWDPSRMLLADPAAGASVRHG